MDKFIKNLEKNLYYWYLGNKGTHEEKLKGLFKSLENIVLPPITDKLKEAIVAYIITRNKIFEAQLIAKIKVNED